MNANAPLKLLFGVLWALYFLFGLLKYLEENSGGGFFFTFHPTYCEIDKS